MWVVPCFDAQAPSQSSHSGIVRLLSQLSLSSSTLQEMISHLRLAMNTVLRTRAAISVLARVLSERDWYLGRVLSQFGLVLHYTSFIASFPSYFFSAYLSRLPFPIS